MSRDAHAPLRKDVKLLGNLLGQTLREQAGEELFLKVERVRSLSKSARAGNERDSRRLEEALASLQTDVVPVVRAFTQFLALANIAEQHHAGRLRRSASRRSAARAPRGSLEDSFERLLAAGVSREKLAEALRRQEVGVVFTAHPTEVVRRTIIQKYRRIGEALAQRDRTDLTAEERGALASELLRESTAIWQTDEIRRTRPTPVDEARSGLVVIEETLWDAVPAFYRRLSRCLEEATGRPLPLDATPIRIGSWVGGDRDGNPNVTAEVTRQVCLLYRWMAADLYSRAVEPLRWELSMTRASAGLRDRVGGAHEPYRELLREVHARLVATRKRMEDLLDGRTPGSAPHYERPDDLEEPLLLCYRSLHENGAGKVADGRLLDLLRRLACFGLSLVQLDIRQEADRHTAALDELTRFVGLGSYARWDEARRQQFLVRELEGKRPLIPVDFPASDEVREVLDTLAVCAAQPPGMLGAYVISMARTPSDVLAVELLQKEMRVAQRMRVAPLFETLEALQSAGDCLRRLLAIPWYRERVAGRQEVMIGYSDSSKEIGRLAATWVLYRAQEEIVGACREHGVKATLFHGRGGSVDRGGGPAHEAILSQPPHSVDGRLRVTEQGEVIQARYGLPAMAAQTMEHYTSATLEATLRPPRAPRKEWRGVMDRLSATARRVYRSVVWEDPDFERYFEAATPFLEIPRLKIGSRPARRRSSGGLASVRAIPWVFSWTQTRLMLPAWLGTGEAFEEARKSGDGKLLRQMWEQWPFLRTNLDLVEMVLFKTDPGVSLRYDQALVPAELRHVGDALRQRLEHTVAEMLELTGHERLLDANPALRSSISVRNPYVDPLNLIQIELLRRLRSTDDERLDDGLLISINGIAAGMRNTG